MRSNAFSRPVRSNSQSIFSKTSCVFVTSIVLKTVRAFLVAIVSGAQGGGLTPAKETSIMGIHFKPGGAFPFLGLPASELSDTHVDLETLWGSSARRLRQRLCEARTSVERFQLLQETLLNRFSHTFENHYFDQSHLIREFLEFSGLSPTEYLTAQKSGQLFTIHA
jgi:hypothetical protein